MSGGGSRGNAISVDLESIAGALGYARGKDPSGVKYLEFLDIVKRQMSMSSTRQMDWCKILFGDVLYDRTDAQSRTMMRRGQDMLIELLAEFDEPAYDPRKEEITDPFDPENEINNPCYISKDFDMEKHREENKQNIKDHHEPMVNEFYLRIYSKIWREIGLGTIDMNEYALEVAKRWQNTRRQRSGETGVAFMERVRADWQHRGKRVLIKLRLMQVRLVLEQCCHNSKMDNGH